MSGNNFGIVIFNLENFASEDIWMERRGLIYLINFDSYNVTDFKESFCFPGLFHFCIILLLVFIYSYCIFLLCSDCSSNCLLWDDEDGVTIVVSSLSSVDKPLLFVSFHGFVPKTATYGICLVAACNVRVT